MSILFRQKMSEQTFTEPILTPDDNRYVMFPIQHDDIWKMYKRQVDCFWIVNEVNLAQDLNDWNSLSDDERQFIKMVLAFFAASDGAVTENLAVRFMADVQISEARAFYGFQIAMEGIHCVVGETKILTDNGYFMIKDLENKKINIWNGEEFTEVEVKYTGNQEIYNVVLSNGMELDCTPGHKWLIQTGNKNHPERCICKEIETKDLNVDDIIERYITPCSEFKDADEFMNPYMHGFFCGDGTYCNNYPMIYLYDKKRELLQHFKYDSIQENEKKIGFYVHKYINKSKYEVPINYSKDIRLRWLEGYVDADGCVNLNKDKDSTSIQIVSINIKFLQDVQLLLTTLGIISSIKLNHKAEKRLLPKNDGSGDYAYYNCKDCYVLYITGKAVNKLMDMGFSPKRLNLIYCERLNTDDIDRTERIKIVSITKILDNEPTYCFNEPKKHAGIFNGILTCQSEMYSLLIDTYIKDAEEKKNLFEATKNYPCITKKFNWAKKWLNDKRSSFASRLVAFACVEGLLFSSSFASIYWLKKRGLMPGLTFSNELISRDEALHTEFAILLYSKLERKLTKKRINEIIKEAVEIEKEFITESIPCRMIGMNAKLMTQYIEFVADRLALQLGYDKIYNSLNPFDFMELISIESKVNFFERTNSEYALANKTVDTDPFEFNADF